MSNSVHGFRSSHDAVFVVLTHPVAGLQESSVQTLASSQLAAGPPTQARLAQVSLVVQAFPSSHEAVLSAWPQPLAGSHESSVQPLASSQLRAAPPTQAPLAQVSLVVQALASSQDTVLPP